MLPRCTTKPHCPFTAGRANHTVSRCTYASPLVLKAPGVGQQTALLRYKSSNHFPAIVPAFQHALDRSNTNTGRTSYVYLQWPGSSRSNLFAYAWELPGQLLAGHAAARQPLSVQVHPLASATRRRTMGKSSWARLGLAAGSGSSTSLATQFESVHAPVHGTTSGGLLVMLFHLLSMSCGADAAMAAVQAAHAQRAATPAAAAAQAAAPVKVPNFNHHLLGPALPSLNKTKNRELYRERSAEEREEVSGELTSLLLNSVSRASGCPHGQVAGCSPMPLPACTRWHQGMYHCWQLCCCPASILPWCINGNRLLPGTCSELRA